MYVFAIKGDFPQLATSKYYDIPQDGESSGQSRVATSRLVMTSY